MSIEHDPILRDRDSLTQERYGVALAGSAEELKQTNIDVSSAQQMIIDGLKACLDPNEQAEQTEQTVADDLRTAAADVNSLMFTYTPSHRTSRDYK